MYIYFKINYNIILLLYYVALVCVCKRELYHLSVDNWLESEFNGCTVQGSEDPLYFY